MTKHKNNPAPDHSVSSGPGTQPPRLMNYVLFVLGLLLLIAGVGITILMLKSPDLFGGKGLTVSLVLFNATLWAAGLGTIRVSGPPIDVISPTEGPGTQPPRKPESESDGQKSDGGSGKDDE